MRTEFDKFDGVSRWKWWRGAVIGLAGLAVSIAVIFSFRTPSPEELPSELTGNSQLTIDRDMMLTQPITLRGHSQLLISGATVTFELANDLDAGIYLEDDARLIVTNSTVTSNRKMYELEFRGRSRLEATNANLLNHSAVKLFDQATTEAVDSLLEEFRMDNQGRAHLVRTEIYPNMQFFTSPAAVLIFPPGYQPVTTTLGLPGAWQLEMVDSIAQGWQVDVYPGITLSIRDSADVNLGLRSNGTANATINLENPASERTNFQLTQLGFDLTVENSEIFFINFYPKGSDQITVNGTPGRTRLLEVVLSDQSQLTLNHVFLMGQLAHVNDQSQLIIQNSTVGSDDPDDPIESELAAQDEAQVLVEATNAQNTDLLVTHTATMTLRNTAYDPARVTQSDESQFVVENN
ncbi:MAG: hypothetical protein AAB647_03440 [Patescibacteria group bacterium]